MSKLNPITRGELLMEEFLAPMGISRYRLAKEIGVPQRRMARSSRARVPSPPNGLRLCRFLGLSSGYWLRAQAAHDTEVAERELAPVSRARRSWAAATAGRGEVAEAAPRRR